MFSAFEGEGSRGMDVQAITRAMRIEGKTSWLELLQLFVWAAQAPEGLAVEVGALYGRSVLAWVVMRRGRGEMLVVDDECRQELIQNLPPDVHWKKGLSWEVAERLPELAFCFIDADHGPNFGKDLAAYTEKMVPGGIIAFHDYEPGRFEVKPLVDEWQESARWEPLGVVDTLIGFRRPT